MILIEPVASVADLDAVRALFLEYAASPDREADFLAYLRSRVSARKSPPSPVRIHRRRAARSCSRVCDGEPAVVSRTSRLGPRRLRDEAPVSCAPLREDSDWRNSSSIGRCWRLARPGQPQRPRYLPSMGAAQRLYARLGFYEIPAYLANPVPGARFLEAELTQLAAQLQRPSALTSGTMTQKLTRHSKCRRLSAGLSGPALRALARADIRSLAHARPVSERDLLQLHGRDPRESGC